MLSIPEFQVRVDQLLLNKLSHEVCRKPHKLVPHWLVAVVAPLMGREVVSNHMPFSKNGCFCSTANFIDWSCIQHIPF